MASVNLKRLKENGRVFTASFSTIALLSLSSLMLSDSSLMAVAKSKSKATSSTTSTSSTSSTTASSHNSQGGSKSVVGKPLNERETVETFISTVSRPDKTKGAAGVFSDAAKTMDFGEMARRGFGDTGWTQFSDAEKNEVTSLFRRLMQLRYFPRWRRTFQNGHFEITSTRMQGADSLVSGQLKTGDKTSELTFRLSKTTDGFRLISMSVKDKDLLERTSVRLKRGLKHKGAQGLIAHLKKKVADSPKEGNDQGPPEDLISGEK